MTADHPLNALLAETDSPLAQPLPEEALARFDAYLALLVRWNARTNLTAIRKPEEILRRHFLESVLVARALPPGIGTLLDYGSGAGFPGLPISICRMEIAVTLAESQHKKAAFLREAVRTVGLAVAVHAERAERLSTHFDCVTLRAVDRMELAVASAARLLKPGGWLAAMTTQDRAETVRESAKQAANRAPGQSRGGEGMDLSKSIYAIHWNPSFSLLPGTSEQLLLGQYDFA